MSNAKVRALKNYFWLSEIQKDKKLELFIVKTFDIDLTLACLSVGRDFEI